MSDLSNTAAAAGASPFAGASSAGVTQLDTAAQTLVELRVISYLLNSGLLLNEDLDQLRIAEANALNY